MRRGFVITLAVVALLIGGCAGSGSQDSSSSNSGRYSMSKDRGPDRKLNAHEIEDAVPQKVVRTKAGNKSPYTVLGKTYRVMPESTGFTQTGEASWYGKKFHGHQTSNGEIYDMYGMTAAHKSLPIPTYVRVTNLDNGLSTVVRVNDRGPFHGGRIIDLSYAAATKLDFVNSGTARVKVEALEAGESYTVNEAQSTGAKVEKPEPTPVTIKPAAQPSVTLPVSSPDDQNYHLPSNTFLQAAAFSSKAAADSAREHISTLTGFPVVVRELNQLYKVRIGPITDNFDLLELRQLLLANQYNSPHVVYD